MIFELIIFDCDGTLVDSEALNCEAVARALNAQGFPEYRGETVHARFMGLKFAETLKEVEKDTGRLPPLEQTRAAFLQHVRDMAEEEMRPVEGAVDLVRACAAHYKICVGSNGERSNVLFSLKKSGFENLFDEENVFTAIQVTNAKPAPDLFLFAAEKMDITPEKCLVIEDSPTGVKAGVAAGMTVWGFTGSAHDRAGRGLLLTEAGADRIFEDFKEMIALFQERKVA